MDVQDFKIYQNKRFNGKRWIRELGVLVDGNYFMNCEDDLTAYNAESYSFEEADFLEITDQEKKSIIKMLLKLLSTSFEHTKEYIDYIRKQPQRH